MACPPSDEADGKSTTSRDQHQAHGQAGGAVGIADEDEHADAGDDRSASGGTSAGVPGWWQQPQEEEGILPGRGAADGREPVGATEGLDAGCRPAHELLGVHGERVAWRGAGSGGRMAPTIACPAGRDRSSDGLPVVGSPARAKGTRELERGVQGECGHPSEGRAHAVGEEQHGAGPAA